MTKKLRSNTSLVVMRPLIAILLLALLYFSGLGRAQPSIKIGVLHSLSGMMAMSEAPQVDVLRMAVDEANREGGLNGRQIEMIIADCRSDAAYCAQQAENMITQDGVQALFGCWTTACRKAVKQVVERHHHLLFYPLQYEGLEESADIFYTGAVPNQQITPAVMWAMQKGHQRFYLIGTDTAYPHTANHIARDVLEANGGRVLSERYLHLGNTRVAAVVDEIIKLKPDVILNTLKGVSNYYFFNALREAGIAVERIPVISTSIAEVDLAEMGAGLMTGNYAVWSYFQSIDNAENKQFVTQFKNRFGQHRVLDEPMEAAYIALRMWVNAVREAGSPELSVVKTLLGQQTMRAPEGVVAMDFSTHHLWKKVRIGKVRADGQFDQVWESPQLVRPAPFPYYRSRLAWGAMQDSDFHRSDEEVEP